jgi:protease-4
MKTTKRNRVWAAVICGLGLLGLNTSTAAAADKDKKAAAAPKATHIHHLTLRGAYSEMPSSSLDLTSLVIGGGLSSKFYFKLVDHLEGLAMAKEVDYLVLDLSQPFLLSRVQRRDFTTRIAKLEHAGIKTIAWVGSVDTAGLCVASACDEIFMSSDGMVDIPSATMAHTFYKDLFNLVGVNVMAIRAGDFKGAVEPFTRSSMSVHLRKHYENLLTSMNNAAVAQIAAGRKLPRKRVRELQQERLMLPATAVKHGLIDKLVEPGRMREAIAKRIGGAVEWDEPKKKKPKSFGLTDLFKMLAGGGDKSAKQTKPTIVVYHLAGEIMDGHKASAGQIIDGPTVAALNALREDEQVKGVVLRINSPGGSATASENIRVAIENLAAKKPIIFSMSDVAASGGYLVACVKAPIYADADTITGSIGVFGMQLNFDTLMRRVGVNLETVAIDKAARQMQLGKPWTEEETQKMQVHVDAVYDLFLNRVSKARGIPVEKLKTMAGGRVWTGAQAKELGLVDKIGGLTAGIDYIRAKAKLDKAEIKHLPKPGSGLDLSGLLGDDDDEIFHGELSRQLNKLNALGFDTKPLEFIFRNARQTKGRPRAMKMWMLQPMNFRIR